MRLRHFALTFAVLFLAAAAAFAQADQARVRVVHASTDAPAVDIYVNGGKAFEAMPFRGFTDYTPLPPGSIMVEVKLAGTDTTVMADTYDLAAGLDYTVMAIGRISNGSLRLLALGDNLNDPGPGMASIRVVHAASQAPAVDVYLSSPYAPLDSLTPALTNVPFVGASVHIPVPAGLYQGRVTVSGTTTVAIDTGEVRLADNQVRTLVALDPTIEGGAFEVLALADKN